MVCHSLPLIVVSGVFGARLLLADAGFERWLMGERGVIELATVLLLVPAMALGAFAVYRSRGLERAWLLALTLTCLYFGGEEISWGQHLVGWETPAALQAVNDQQETNLHNISSWLDQKPRLLLELWVLGLAIAALSTRFRNAWGRYAFIWSDRRLAVAAILALLVRLPERLASWPPHPFDFRLAELQELMFAVVLLLYLWARAASGARSSEC